MNRYGGNNNRFDRPRQDFGQVPPVNVGDELELKIEAVGEKGDGIAKKDGFVIFVPNVKEGEYVKVKVTRVLRKVGFGESLGKVDKPSVGTQAASGEKEQKEEELDYSPENDSDNFGEDETTESEEESTEEEDQ